MRGELEQKLRRRYPTLVGVDEVGRGCIAGPVYAAAVVLNYAKLRPQPRRVKDLLRDSKTLSSRQRQAMLPLIAKLSLSSAVGFASVQEIEELGIVPATFKAMTRALAALTVPVDMLLIDGNRPLVAYPGPQTAVVKGDFHCYCIAAASILAKEARDLHMSEQASLYPAYGFDSHVGYSTKQHLSAIKTHGICALHRRNFAPIKETPPALPL